jgi:hypothetical protein
MTRAIVITSIFAPTEAVKRFSKIKGYKLIVVGDKKTPANWYSYNVEYLSLENQNLIGSHLNKVLPYNHYCRKMMGYLYAIKNGAEYIVDTDDDNIPKKEWSFPDFKGMFSLISNDEGFVNIYQLYTNQKIWPRGLPLKLINKDFELENKLNLSDCKIGIWQGLADEDPDVDAVYRLTLNASCYFKNRLPVVLGENTITTFNTQNTMIRKELFPLMYLPAFVSFRFTDILRGLIAQPIMWLYGYKLGYTNATVVQKRNDHDFMNDFLSEIPMYEHCEKIVGIVKSVILVNNNIMQNLLVAYEALKLENIVSDQEIVTLKAWLKDIE